MEIEKAPATAGDILLVRGNNKISWGLVTAQKTIYAQACSSHVAISLDCGAFIHSTSKGVHIDFIPRILSECRSDWRVIRLRSVTDKQRWSLIRSSNFYLGQDYNRKFMLPGNASSSFCSELAAKAYIKAGMNVFEEKDPSQVTPAFFDRQADKLEEWEDVTEEHRALISEMEAEPTRAQAAYTEVAASLRRLQKTNMKTEMLTQLALEIVESDAGKEEIRDARRKLESETKHKYWNVQGDDKPSDGN